MFLTTKVLPVPHMNDTDRYVVSSVEAIMGFYAVAQFLGFRDQATLCRWNAAGCSNDSLPFLLRHQFSHLLSQVSRLLFLNLSVLSSAVSDIPSLL